MSVFKIQQQGVATQATHHETKTIEKEADLSKEPNVVFKDANPPIEENNGTEAVEKPDLMVKIDGPVGRVFTDALNKLLVQESYMTMSPEIFHDTKSDHTKQVDVQVYCWNANNLNTEDVVQITNDITKNKAKDYVIAVEALRPTASMRFLGELEKLPNVKLCFSYDKAAAIVSDRLRGK